MTHKVMLCREDTFFDYFVADLQRALSQVIIYSPFMAENRLSMLLPYLKDAISRGCRIVVVTKQLSEHKGNMFAQCQKCKEELLQTNVKVIHKKGMHEKLIFIDDSVVWNGSLNVLSFTGQTGEIMNRFFDEKIFAEQAKVSDIEHICEVAFHSEEQKCPVCKGNMIAADSDSGGFYWVCENGDYSRNPKQQHPVDGILQCHCGASYTFAMKKEPRWVCTANSLHHRKIHAGDLKLEKMYALIPASARKGLVEYFAANGKKGTSSPKLKTTAKKVHPAKATIKVKVAMGKTPR